MPGTSASASLTSEERARLRPSVDQSALERFLEAAPPGFRRYAVLACSDDLTDEEFAALGLVGGFRPRLMERLVGGLIDDPELVRLWQHVEPRPNRGA